MADHRAFEPETLPTPDRPWTHGIQPAGRPLYISGQTSVDADGNVVSENDLSGQFQQALENVQRVLSSADGSLDDIAKLTIYVTDLDTWRADDVGSIRYEYLEPPYPASTLIEVTGLANPAYLVEVEGVAYLGE